MENDQNYLRRKKRNNAIKYGAAAVGVGGAVGLGAFAMSRAFGGDSGGGGDDFDGGDDGGCEE